MLFRKKQITSARPRNVPARSAKIFSYNMNRAVSEVSSPSRRTERMSAERLARELSGGTRKWLRSRLFSYLFGAVMVVSLLYVSTLGSDARLQFDGTGKPAGLVQTRAAYQSGIRNILEESPANKSKLFIDTNKIARQISERYPELGKADVMIPLIGRRLVINVESAKPRLLLISGEKGFVLDSSGRIIARDVDLDSSVVDKLPVVNDDSGLPMELGSYAVSGETVRFVSDITAQLESKDFHLRQMDLTPAATELRVKIDGAQYYIKFDLKGDSRLQAGTFIAVHKRLMLKNITPGEYVDARVPGKAYYK